ncbi:hypothetical protein IJE86_10935 [bacterium]|nr:hypothetical protein [bacterium]
MTGAISSCPETFYAAALKEITKQIDPTKTTSDGKVTIYCNKNGEKIAAQHEYAFEFRDNETGYYYRKTKYDHSTRIDILHKDSYGREIIYGYTDGNNNGSYETLSIFHIYPWDRTDELKRAALVYKKSADNNELTYYDTLTDQSDNVNAKRKYNGESGEYEHSLWNTILNFIKSPYLSLF